MAKKRFEEIEYDPIEAEAKRTLARAVSLPGVAATGSGHAAKPTKVVQFLPESSKGTETPAAAPEEKVLPAALSAGPGPSSARQRKPKSRTFSCANVEQDQELDGFLLRLKEVSGTHLPFQVLMRAACMVTMRAEEQINAEIRKSSPPALPAKFAHAEYAQFEEYWIDILAAAMRKVRPLQ